MLESFEHIHFIGIGGIGISSLAYLALSYGRRVTGSDSTESALIDDLRSQGAHIVVGHSAGNILPATHLVIYTEAIDKHTNPEFLEAQKLGIRCLSYFEALGEISRTKKTIVVIGTHGKTTTTSMLGIALVEAGLDPTVIVGTKVPAFQNKNLHIGKSDLFVVEACEYRRSFLRLDPFGVVLLNCEAEHLDYYKDEADYIKAFQELMIKVPDEGFVVANMDDKNVLKLVPHVSGRVIEVRETEVQELGLKLKIPGHFNEKNATQAYKAALNVGADPDKTQKSLENFKGTWRRMEIKSDRDNILIMDDYGHHPTEVRSTLEALKEWYPKRRLICVFQPHQYSRTWHLLDQFKQSFAAADLVIVPNIYAARDTEEDKKKISPESFVHALSENHPHVIWGRDFDNTLQLIQSDLRPGDLIITMGAGNVSQIADRLTE